MKRCCDIRNGTGLEIGPLATPVVRRGEGRIYYADYFPADEVAQTYPDAAPGRILDVDFVLREHSYASIRDKVGRLDYLIASHVFEHLPNPLGWLREVAAVMQPGGIISLAIPDKRHSSEYFRRETTLEQLLGFDDEDLRQPSPQQLRDCLENLHRVDMMDTWIGRSIRADPVPADVEAVVARAAAGTYVDAHCTAWTSQSFDRVVSAALKLRRIPLKIVRVDAPLLFTAEFIAQLKRED